MDGWTERILTAYQNLFFFGSVFSADLSVVNKQAKNDLENGLIFKVIFGLCHKSVTWH